MKSFVFLGLTLHTLLVCKHQKSAQSNKNVNKLYKPWPSTKNGFYEVPVKKPDKSPVKTTYPKEPPSKTMNTALTIFHRILVKNRTTE